MRFTNSSTFWEQISHVFMLVEDVFSASGSCTRLFFVQMKFRKNSVIFQKNLENNTFSSKQKARILYRLWAYRLKPINGFEPLTWLITKNRKWSCIKLKRRKPFDTSGLRRYFNSLPKSGYKSSKHAIKYLIFLLCCWCLSVKIV